LLILILFAGKKGSYLHPVSLPEKN